MKWSFRIARIAGTDVRIHLTFVLLLAVFAVALVAEGGLIHAVSGLTFLTGLFFCVLLHEFGHALAARHYGIRTPDITLLPIGGLARLERMPEKPAQEFIIAVAGPMVNVAIAAALFLVLGRLPVPDDLTNLSDPATILPNLARVNVLLVLFNMIPAFPMDGGRVLRALLATRLDYARATQIAARIGQALAVIGGVLAIFFTRNPLLFIIAIFIYFAAAQESQSVQTRAATNHLRVRHAMLTRFRTLNNNATLQDAVDALLAGSQHDFPIVDENNHAVGLLLRSDLIAALAKHGPTYPANELARDFPVHLTPDTPLTDAMEHVQAHQSHSLPVFESPTSKSLTGLLTKENVIERLLINSALQKQPQPPPLPTPTE
ncbi:MAG: site-2 protease family protein [Verrucomicrobiota bacterium]